MTATASSIWKAIAQETDPFTVEPQVAEQLAEQVESIACESAANAPSGPRRSQQATVLDPHPAPVPDGRDNANLLAALGAYLHYLRRTGETGSVAVDRNPVTKAAIQGDTAAGWAPPRVRHPALALLVETGLGPAGRSFLARLGLVRCRAQSMDEILLQLALVEVSSRTDGYARQTDEAKGQRDASTARAVDAENALLEATTRAEAAEGQLPGLQATIDRQKAELADLKRKLKWLRTLTGETGEPPAPKPEPKPEPAAPAKRRRIEA